MKGRKGSSRTRDLVLTSIVAATYGAGTIAISPISYGPVQARLTDALIPTSYNKKVGKAAVIGTALGCIIANVVSPYGLPDVVIGTLANLLASGCSYACRKTLGIKGKLLASAVVRVRCSAPFDDRDGNRWGVNQLRRAGGSPFGGLGESS
ncbi:MAG: QueT transporter family protein [Candidatus Brockarchaeota archaeon]|nr:QueT transporter family protein [Candidatus Brockarchaeota archaeon]